MARGSGVSGLGAMARQTLLPTTGENARKSEAIVLIRPLLELPKQRLIATLAATGITFVDDPSNRDPRFTRPRLRALMPALAEEGLDAHRLAMLARRMRRVDETIEAAVDAAIDVVSDGARCGHRAITIAAEKWVRLPAEVSGG